MNDFPITYLRNDGQDEPVVAFHDKLLVFELPSSRESFLYSKIQKFKRVITGHKLSNLHALSSGVHFNLPKINAYDYCDSEVKQYLEDARTIASQHSNTKLTSAHLLLAMLKESFVQCFFTKRLEISLDNLSHHLASNIAALPNGTLVGADTQLSKIMLKAAGIARERGEESIRLIDLLTSLVSYDVITEQVMRKFGYSENDRENLVTWLKLTAGTCSRIEFPKPQIMSRFLLWAGPVNYPNSELVVARDLAISNVMSEISNGRNFIILKMEEASGIDAVIGLLSSKHLSMAGAPLIELHVSEISIGASASKLEERFQTVFTQLQRLKHPVLVIRGFEELLGVSGNTGFDFTALLSRFAAQKKISIITVLNNQSFARLKDTNLLNLSKVIDIDPLDINGKIQLLLAQLTHLEEVYRVMISYSAIKIFAERIQDYRPRYLIDRLKNIVPQNTHTQVELITGNKMNDLLSQAGL